MRQFKQRLRLFEKRYYLIFLRELTKVNREVEKDIKNGFFNTYQNIIDNWNVEKLYEQLYYDVSVNEAKFEQENMTLEKQTRPGGIISFFRSLIREYIYFRIAHRITAVKQTTKDRVAFIIEKGIEEGKGAVDVAKDIRNDFDFNKNRAMNIARTETVTAMNLGKFMARQNSPYKEEKRWIPANDDRTRESHLALSDVGWIDLGSDFHMVNNSGILEPALFPGDDRLSAENTCNCRCTLSFRPKKDNNGRLIRKENINNVE